MCCSTGDNFVNDTPNMGPIHGCGRHGSHAIAKACKEGQTLDVLNM